MHEEFQPWVAECGGCAVSSDILQSTGAIADAIGGDPQAIEHGKVQIGHGRLALEPDMASGLEGATAAASQEDG